MIIRCKKVQVGNDQEKVNSEKDSHSNNRSGKKLNQQSGTYKFTRAFYNYVHWIKSQMAIRYCVLKELV